MRLGKLGAWAIIDGITAAAAAEFARRVEHAGYSALWMGEALGRDALVTSSWLLANTERLIVATGIANLYARDPMAMAAARAGLNEQSGGRFLLGIGISHAPLVDGLRGHHYGKPVATMRAYLEAMERATYVAPPAPEKPTTVLAALGPQMLALSRDMADGAHPYNVTPEHTAEARAILGPAKLLCVEQMVLLETDPDRAREAGRRTLATYLGLPNYVNNWRRFGFVDADFADGGSDRLIDAIVAWGDEAAIADRVREHWDAGADHVCIQALSATAGEEGVWPAPDIASLEKLAPFLSA